MRIIFSSKNVELTDGLKLFIERKLTTLQKFTSSGLSNVSIFLNVDRKRKGTAEDAVVEMVGNVKDKTVTVREHGTSFYQAFFGALTKMRRRLAKEKDRKAHR